MALSAVWLNFNETKREKLILLVERFNACVSHLLCQTRYVQYTLNSETLGGRLRDTRDTRAIIQAQSLAPFFVFSAFYYSKAIALAVCLHFQN